MTDNSSPNFWWLNANTRMWDPRNLPIGSTQSYTTHNDDGNKRQIYANFSAVKAGDLMLGYITSPDRVVSCVFEITKEKHIRTSDRKEIIEFKLVEKFNNPVSWNQLKSMPSLSDAQPLKNNQGSLFTLSKEQFDAIVSLANSAENLADSIASQNHEPSQKHQDYLDIKDWTELWREAWQGPDSSSHSNVPEYLKHEAGDVWKNIRQQWEIGHRELNIAVELACTNQDPGTERVRELIMGSLRRTMFSGGWRTHVLTNFSSIAKSLRVFVAKYPTGCSQAALSSLLDELKPLTGGARIKAVVTRWLSDLAPQYYLPVSDKFTAIALQQAAALLTHENHESAPNEDYEFMCQEAVRLTFHLPNVSQTKPMLEFDYFLYWLHNIYLEQHTQTSLPNEIISDSNQTRYWKISCGQGGRYAGIHRITGRISIGWGETGDLRLFKDKTLLKENLRTNPDLPFDASHAAQQCWDFSHEIQVGDIIFGYGQGHILLVGEVIGPYEYLVDSTEWKGLTNSDTDLGHRHVLPVKWFTTRKISAKELSDETYRKITRTQTIIDLSTEEGLLIMEKAGLAMESAVVEENIHHPGISLEQLCDGTGLEPEFFERLKARIQIRQQVIFTGPPGTGKTHVAEYFAQWFMQGNGRQLKLQFHPSYAYEDFVEGYRPLNDGNGFQVTDGVFKDFCLDALTFPNVPFVLIIDEINRGHLAQIFGELLTLLEYRGKGVIKLPYSKKEFSIPPNVYLIGTMNTADRSIALMDFALRRRFDFFEFGPSTPALINFLKQHNCQLNPDHVAEFLSVLNAKIREKLGRHYQIGHSYLMRANLDTILLKDIWDFGIKPLLEEYFYDQPALDEEFEFESIWNTIQGSPKVA